MELKDEYFFDSYAIIELINQSPNYSILQDVSIKTNVLCLGEVYHYYLKSHDKKTADFWINYLKVDLLETTKEIAIQAASLRFEYRKRKFSYPDCIGYITALKNNLKFLTGDSQFESMKNVEFIK